MVDCGEMSSRTQFWMGLLVVALGWVGLGCSDLEPMALTPLSMDLARDGQVRAGIAIVDITPELGETFTDLNGNNEFDGCLDDPEAKGEDCDEPFDDVDGDGTFEPVWIGGFGPLRPMLGVHDPIYARALVLSFDGQYIVLVSLDLVGLATQRIHEARDALAKDGFDGDRLIVASSHDHGSPDTMGLWGDPEAFVSGLNQDYQALLAVSIENVAREAAAKMVPVSLRVGATQMRDESPKWFNGKNFGGKNPVAIMHGLIYDGRDPVVVSDQLLVLQGMGADDEAVFTLTNWSGHPETRGDNNNLLTSDYVHTLRGYLEDKYGGTAMHLPECLGGMQSTLSGDVPLVDEMGEHQFQSCDAEAVADAEDTECFGLKVGAPRLDSDSEPVPQWAERESWEFVHSLGIHLGEAAAKALEAGEAIAAAPIMLEVEDFSVPITNATYNLLGPFDIFDLGQADAVYDAERCPEYISGDTKLGCIITRTFRARIGPVGFSAVPGELLPELAWGFPDEDSRWKDEVADPSARGPGAVYFRQHDPNCNAIDYADCRNTDKLGDCDCLAVHAWPYRLSDDSKVKPILDAWLTTDVSYRAVIGMADNYLSYIIPEPDFNSWVTVLGKDGDHYEDTVSPTHDFASRVLAAQQRIDARWPKGK